jgi:hypothetical protein
VSVQLEATSRQANRDYNCILEALAAFVLTKHPTGEDKFELHFLPVQ